MSRYMSFALLHSHIQALDDIRNDRYPLSSEECAFVAALRAQVEFGNHDPAAPPLQQYAPIVEKYVPKHFRDQVRPEDIIAHHLKLRDTAKQV